MKDLRAEAAASQKRKINSMTGSDLKQLARDTDPDNVPRGGASRKAAGGAVVEGVSARPRLDRKKKRAYGGAVDVAMADAESPGTAPRQPPPEMKQPATTTLPPSPKSDDGEPPMYSANQVDHPRIPGLKMHPISPEWKAWNDRQQKQKK